MHSYDVLIIGGGGAGLTAAIYTSRAKLKTILLEKLAPGGQIALTDVVENYPGFPKGVTGPEISLLIEEQAKKYGTEVRYEAVESIVKGNNEFVISTASKKKITARSVIITSGAAFRTLNVPLEKELTGRGVSYCATCDGAFFKDKEIVVVGGGDAAMQEGIFLTRFVKKLTVVHRRDQLRASPILQDRARENQKIEFMWNTVVTEIKGKDKVEGVRLNNVKTNDDHDFKTDGVFIFIGHDPATSYLKGFVKLDEKGYVVAEDRLQTSVPGVFAAGEVRAGAVKQLVTACGEGCEAALEAQAYVEELEPASKN
jgi:thioredoxin reductase (NADPH)